MIRGFMLMKFRYRFEIFGLVMILNQGDIFYKYSHFSGTAFFNTDIFNTTKNPKKSNPKNPKKLC